MFSSSSGVFRILCRANMCRRHYNNCKQKKVNKQNKLPSFAAGRWGKIHRRRISRQELSKQEAEVGRGCYALLALQGSECSTVFRFVSRRHRPEKRKKLLCSVFFRVAILLIDFVHLANKNGFWMLQIDFQLTTQPPPSRGAYHNLHHSQKTLFSTF